jgi:hypothetical protein
MDARKLAEAATNVRFVCCCAAGVSSYLALLHLKASAPVTSGMGSNRSSDNFGWSNRPFVALDGSYADLADFRRERLF